MVSVFRMLSMAVAQQLGPQRLGRTPEPEQITDASNHVLQYDQVMTTKLVIAYACGLMVVHRARTMAQGGSAIDLACGPGHYTLCLARYLGYDKVLGIDLAPPMVKVAARNAAEQRLDRSVEFRLGDVTKLGQVRSNEFDLGSFTSATHHLPDLATVTGVLRQMDRITKQDGVVMVMDLVRLRTAQLTERYVNTLGQDYAERGLSSFLEDFRNSMYAEWTANEFHQAIPKDSDRYWCHLVPRGLPTVQVIVGLPVGRKAVFVRSGFRARENPLVRQWYPRWQEQVSRQWAKQTLKEWRLMRLSLALARKRMIPPGK